MKTLLLTIVLFFLIFCAGCGSNSGGPFIPKGNFSNASLKGQYVYQLSGTDSIHNGLPYYEAGVFAADGNGNLTSVSDDFSEGATPTSTTGTGAYSIKNDGTGSLTLNNAIGTPVTLAVTMVTPSGSSTGAPSKVYLIEADAGLNSSGIAEAQDTTVISSAPSGTFAFRQHTVDSAQTFASSSASVGVFTVSGGTVSSGTMDVDRGGVLNNGGATPLSLTSGSFNAPATLGRGTGTSTDSSNTTSSFIYYIVDANNVRFLSSSSGLLGIGRAEKQSAPALSGSYAFGGRGDTQSTFVNGVNTAGAFTASGGSITSGAIDAVEDGGTLSTTITSGSYTTPGANGRATITLNASSGSLQATLWMVSAARGFFLITNDTNAVEDGTLGLQSGTFTNATMNGQFAFMMDGFDTTQLLDRLGTLTWDGTSKLTLNEVANSSITGQGAISPGVLSGSYSVASNGRAVGTINNLSLSNNDLVFYLISGSSAYLLQNDTGVQINGMISIQTQ